MTYVIINPGINAGVTKASDKKEMHHSRLLSGQPLFALSLYPNHCAGDDHYAPIIIHAPALNLTNSFYPGRYTFVPSTRDYGIRSALGYVISPSAAADRAVKK